MFVISPDKEWQGTVLVIKPWYKTAYVVLRNCVLPPPNWWSETEARHRNMLGIRCWQRVDQLDFKVGDRVGVTNLDIDGLSVASYPCDDGENGTKGKFNIIKSCDFLDRHLINYEYMKSWKDISSDEFEGAMYERLSELFPDAIISVRKGRNTHSVCGGTHDKDFISKHYLDQIASVVVSRLRSRTTKPRRL